MRLATGLVCLALVVVCALQAKATGSTYSRTANYQNEIVIRCPDKKKATIQTLQAHSDVWHVGKDTIDVRLSKKTFARVQNYFPKCHIVVANVESFVQQAEVQMFRMAEEQAWVQEVMAETIPKCGSLKQCEAALEDWEADQQMSSSFFEQYHPYEDIKSFYKTLSETHANLVTYMPSIGKTAEGRDMPAVHITASKNPNRKRFYMQCQIHAREWITGGVCMYIANHLATEYEKSSRVKSLLDNMEFVMVPIVNPDGIAYTWEHDRLWRKNRKQNSYSPSCPGVDINRNFPLGFLHKSIGHACDEDYPGFNAGSEHETKNIMKFFRNNAPIVGSIDWHSYGQLILRPYGYTNASAPDESFMLSLSNTMKDKIHSVHGQHYSPEKSEELYFCYGIAADWLYSNNAASTNKGYRSASICIELRDSGHPYGFLLPADQIVPTAEEVLPAVLYYAETMLNHPLIYNRKSQLKEPVFDAKKHHSRNGL
ncbi:carboxypeptidase O-like isoform X2 [Halichondria panicea]|uniref:carboxypeptidase O-like isoform X2 n=1 Tax=Halichondria panicea TaxID=6063 RepID=UPI00312B9846